jgi:hypothetical protein
MDALSNPLALRNLYPNAGGASSAQAGSAMTPATTADTSDIARTSSSGLMQTERAFKIGVLGEPVKFWLLLTVLLFGGMWVARRFGGSANFANVKFSLYNVIAIVVLTIVGQSIAKVLFTRFPVPGISTIVLAA